MKIELYTFLYDNIEFLPYFLQHYSFVDKITFIDIGASNDVLDMVSEHTIIKCKNVAETTEMRNTIWNESKYDLVMFPDLDEILYKENLRGFLESNTYDIYQTKGYNMVSKNYPENINTVRCGTESSWYDKALIFNPKCDIRFVPGAHKFTTNSHNINKFDIKLLHYFWLGLDTVLRRRQLVIDNNPKQYVRSIPEIQKIFENELKNAVEVI